MLTIPIQAANESDATPPARRASVLVIGRSENVLRETVQILRDNGQSAGATNDFQNVPSLFEPAAVSAVVFGGMVPPDMKESLRGQLRAANARIEFIQGLAGIPGLIAAQVEAALAPALDDAATADYEPVTRVVKLDLDSPQRVRLVGFWGTSFVPPEPASTSEEIFNEPLSSGRHVLPLPEWFPDVGSFIVVRSGSLVQPFTVGPMPQIDLLAPPTSAEPPTPRCVGITAAVHGGRLGSPDARPKASVRQNPRPLS